MQVMSTGMVHQELGQLRPATDSAIASEMQVNLKRQRRPSVRLGEIGDEPMPLVLKKLFKRRKPRPSDNATAAYVHPFVDGLGNLPDSAGVGVDGHKPKRVKPMKQAINATANRDEMHYADSDGILAERFQEELRVYDDGTDGYSQPLRKVHVSLKKRTKRGKHARRKRLLTSRSSVASSAKIAKILEENSKDIANLTGVDGASHATVHNSHVGTQTETLESLEKDVAGFDNPQFEQTMNPNVDSHCGGHEKADKLIESEGTEKMLMKGGHDSNHKEVDSKHESIFQEEATNEMPDLEVVRDPEVSSNLHLNAIAAIQNHVNKADEGITHLVNTGAPALNCEVARWLEALSLGKYAYLFELHEVDKDVLPHLTIDDLREMGIVAVGTRRKLFTAIQTMGHKE